jgi:hypothetical protein
VVDAVVVGHDPQYPYNYFVQDSVDEIIGGVFTGGLQQLHIGVTGDNLIQGDGLIQQFDAIPAKDGSRTWGTFFRRIGHTISGFVTFDLSRVSLTPGSCRP